MGVRWSWTASGGQVGLVFAVQAALWRFLWRVWRSLVFRSPKTQASTGRLRCNRLNGQRKVEGRARAQLGLGPNAASVPFDDLFADSQANAGAGILTAVVQPLEDDK